MIEEFNKAVAEVEDGEWYLLRRKVQGRWVDTGQEWRRCVLFPTGWGTARRGRIIGIWRYGDLWLGSWRFLGWRINFHFRHEGGFGWGEFSSGDFGENAA
jgi:hypothetical protein